MVLEDAGQTNRQANEEVWLRLKVRIRSLQCILHFIAYEVSQTITRTTKYVSAMQLAG